MLAEVRNLLLLQEIDAETRELQEQLKRYPVAWDDVKADVTRKRAALEAASSADQDHTDERRKMDIQLARTTEALKKYEAQRDRIKTAKEYNAINAEIEGARKKIADLEEAGIALLTRDDEVKGAVATARKAVEEAERFARAEKERLRVLVNEKKDRLDALKAERGRQVVKMDPQALVLYERINKRWPGSAVVTARGGSCTGCNFKLLSNQLVEVHKGEKFCTCHNCSRILSEEEGYVAASLPAS